LQFFLKFRRVFDKLVRTVSKIANYGRLINCRSGRQILNTASHCSQHCNSKTEFPPAFLSASTLEAPNFSATAAADVPPPPARLFLPSEKVVEVEEVREGVGEGGLLLPPTPPPDRSELVLPTYIELFACILFPSFSIFFIHIFTINLMKLVNFFFVKKLTVLSKKAKKFPKFCLKNLLFMV